MARRENSIIAAARREIAAEERRAAIEREKERLRQYRPWWKRLFPWRITITKEQ